MALTTSESLPLGADSPDFALPDTDGKTVALADFKDRKALLVMFICNHCPYVKHVMDGLTKLADDYLPRGVGIVAISSNDAAAYPEDSPQKMKELKARLGWSFPYLHDESQEVAKKYRAVCTPEFFVFDAQRKLVYHGQFDDTRPTRISSGNYRHEAQATGADVRAALDAALAGRGALPDQKPAAGCSIKWKPGNQPG